ncbi:MAG: precorrin-2 C(20)-methyltransferase [Clostridiales Family XIII bacterium]|nr:precorrin-2 C(20)-methyltransferase [Clostridiales Family XIII bacterium]
MAEAKKTGTLYGVGVGPGDPELLTRKAVRVLLEAGTLFFPEPRGGSGKVLAFEIACAACPELAAKKAVGLYLPMTRDAGELAKNRLAAARRMEEALDAGEDAAFLTLGDPSVYSTYFYLHRIVEGHGYPCKIVPGVTSFCAAAAAAGLSLADAEDPIHILPASYPDARGALAQPGTKVLMKTGKSFREVKEELAGAAAADAVVVENCGMPGERIRPLSAIAEGDEPGYFSVILVKGGAA